MQYGPKIESLFRTIVDDVSTVLTPNIDKALDLVRGIESFDDHVPFVEWLHDCSVKNSGIVPIACSTAIVSDLLLLTRKSVFADTVIDDAELSLAVDLLSGMIQRFAYRKEYKKFARLRHPCQYLELILLWDEDATYFGGNFDSGAVGNPFALMVILASLIQGDSLLHSRFTQATLLVARMILAVNGTSASEQEMYEQVRKLREAEGNLIHSVLDRLRPSSNQQASAMRGDVVLSDPAATSSPAKVLESSLQELENLVGVPEVKAEVKKLTNFLRIRQHRLAAGLPVANQSLHFVFTGNPGTGKTTVARIIGRILYGFEILSTERFIEADRSMLVGGYVGQTAIKTSEMVEKSINGVLFIDEAYTLSKDGVNDYGQEAIETLLKKMEDFRDRLVVIVAGYPQKMGDFLCSNPGLESRFTRFIRFDDYHVSDLCSIFERMCKSNAYQLTQQARANLAIFFNIAFASKDDRFGNARFVRNAYEKAVGRHADRLAEGTDAITAEMLSTLEAPDIPFEMLGRLAGPFDVLNSRWSASCPQCNKVLGAPLALIGNRVNCKCGANFRYPWWNLRPETVPGLGEFTVYERPSDLTGYDVAARG